MADLSAVYDALRKADAAGNTADAQQLAAYIRTQGAADPAAAPAASASQPGSVAQNALAGAGRETGLLARAGIEGATALPLLAGNAGIQLGNLINNHVLPHLGIPAPAHQLQPIDPSWLPTKLGLPQPQGALEKIQNVIGSAVAGAKLPTGVPEMPPVAQPSVRDLTLGASQRAGYVVPPSTTNPTVLNKLLESVGGKVATAQDAARANQPVTNALVRKGAGLAESDPITSQALADVRNEAAGAYNAVRGAGTITPTARFSASLDKIAAPFQSAGKDFPGLARDDITSMIDGLKQPQFDANSAVDAISLLRGQADKAFAGGDKAMGHAAKDAAGALEGAIETHLASQDQDASQALQNFRDARQQIAKTYSAEKALNPATGNVSATKLATQLSRGKPLSGPLATAAKFGAAFPKAAAEANDSSSVRNTDILAGMGAAAFKHQPWYLLYPFARMAARSALLGSVGQKLAVPGAMSVSPGLLTGTASGLLSSQ